MKKMNANYYRGSAASTVKVGKRKEITIEHLKDPTVVCTRTCDLSVRRHRLVQADLTLGCRSIYFGDCILTTITF